MGIKTSKTLLYSAYALIVVCTAAILVMLFTAALEPKPQCVQLDTNKTTTIIK